MNREKACLTADDKLRVPSLSGESLHEYSATNEAILYRLIKLDGSPHKGRIGMWKVLSLGELLKHLVSCEWQPTAATWFRRHGITVERLRDQREAERKRKLQEQRRNRLNGSDRK